MKYSVGDLLRAKEAMIVMNGVDGEGDEEEVEKGQYFVITDKTIEKAEYESITYILLCQKTCQFSRWNVPESDMVSSFSKVKIKE
jgi:hypothetical protein